MNDVQVATRSCIPTPIILEILDDEDKQLAAKGKQQQAQLKKGTDALEHMWESKKVAEEVVESKHKKKAACKMDEMAQLERMQEHHDHDMCCAMYVSGTILMVCKHD